MIQPPDLLAHAQLLARSSDEADLRRAVSAAYYALFHSLVASGARFFLSAGEPIIRQVTRAFEHGTMCKVCRAYVQPPLRQQTDPRILLIAQVFIDLQDARVTADYDLVSDFAAADAARLVGNVSGSLRLLPDVARGSEGCVFLAKLLLGPRLGRRG